MIISFRFKNFRSFPDETYIDMKAISYKELPSHLILAYNKEMIKTLAIYGENASGKTNLFLALASFQTLIIEQLLPLKAISKNSYIPFLKHCTINQIVPFHTTVTNTQPTEMELSFISNQHVYEYGFTIRDQDILTEHMIVDHHVVYIRAAKKISIGRHFERSFIMKPVLAPHDKKLFCSVLSCLDIPEITAIMKPFELFFSEHIVYYFGSPEPFQFLGNTATEERIYKLLENPNALHYGLEQLQKLGIPAMDFIIEHGSPMLGFHIKSRTTGQYQTQYMDFTKISTHTMIYLFLFMNIYCLSEKGGVLLIDNISNEFQPAVLKFIVDIFQQENNRNSQLIFTTWDRSILDNQQFRRDEVAIVDINEYLETKLYTLTDLMSLADSSFIKDYLLKKYRTVPFIKDYISASQGRSDSQDHP